MRKTLIFSSLLLLSSAAFADALDDSAQRTNTITSKQDNQQVSSTLAGNYTQLAGSQDNANALVNGLRTGQSITLTSKSGTSTTVEGSGKSMGWGGVNNTLALVQASLQKANITNPTGSELALAVSSITALRSAGMGWGQIAQSMGLNLGAVVSSSRASEKALSHRSSHSEVEHGLEAEHQQGELHKSGTATEHAGKSDDSAGRNSGQKGDDGAKGSSGSSSSGGKGSSGSDSKTRASVRVERSDRKSVV